MRSTPVRRHWLGLSILATGVIAGCASPGGRDVRDSPATTIAPHPAAALSNGGGERSPEKPVFPAGGLTAPSAPAMFADAALQPTPAHAGQTISQVSYSSPESVVAPLPPDAPAAPIHADDASTQAALLAADPCDPFAGQGELPLAQLLAEVEARNPSLQAASEAWRAAAQRYPQVVSLEDPMFGFMVSPTGVGQDGGGWMVEASQKLPWAGKRYFRGNMAQAEADAAKGEIGDTRLMLAEATKMAFFDYYLARRELEVNADTANIVKQFRDIARTKYESN